MCRDRRGCAHFGVEPVLTACRAVALQRAGLLQGFVVIEAGQRHRPRRHAIIALTANALRDEELRCRQAGMDGYLTKPVRLAQLKAAIDAWLRPAAPRPSTATPDASARIAPPPADLAMLAELIGNDP